MVEFAENKNKVIVTLDDEYWANGDIIAEDDLVVAIVKYLRKMGERSDLLGFDVLNRYVLLINEDCYNVTNWGNGRSEYPKITLKKVDLGVIENRFKDRVIKIKSKLVS